MTITVNDAAPSALTYSTESVTYTKSVAITTNSPSNGGGTIVTYAIAPALPAGISLSTTTGAITGTPTAITSVASYTVTGTNTGGSTTKALNITVNDAAPTSLTYSADPATYTIATAITDNTPSSGGGTVLTYAISPALPTGLTFSTTTGIMSGTPTATNSGAVGYTVTASNTGGSTTRSVTIKVTASASQSVLAAAHVPGTDANPVMTMATNDTILVKLTAKGSGGTQLAAGGMSVTLSLTGGTSGGTLTSVTDVGDGTYTAGFTATLAGTAKTVSATMNGITLSSTLPQIKVISGANDGAFSGNLLAWFKADAIGGGDGTAVASWTDSSSNGLHATQTTDAKKPLLYNNIAAINSKPVVRFYRGGVSAGTGTSTCTNTENGGTSLVANSLAAGGGIASISSNTDFSIFYVAKGTSVGDSNNGNNHIIAFHRTTNYDNTIKTGTSTSGTTCAGTTKQRVAIWGANLDSTATSTIAEMQTFRAVVMTYSAAKAGKAFINGGTAVVDATSAGTFGPSETTMGLIGGQYKSTGAINGYFDGDIAEIIVFKTVLSDADRQAILDYLAAKYALTAVTH